MPRRGVYWHGRRRTFGGAASAKLRHLLNRKGIVPEGFPNCPPPVDRRLSQFRRGLAGRAKPDAHAGATSVKKFDPEFHFKCGLDLPQNFEPPVVHLSARVVLQRNNGLSAYTSDRSQFALIDSRKSPSRANKTRRGPDHILGFINHVSLSVTF